MRKYFIVVMQRNEKRIYLYLSRLTFSVTDICVRNTKHLPIKLWKIFWNKLYKYVLLCYKIQCMLFLYLHEGVKFINSTLVLKFKIYVGVQICSSNVYFPGKMWNIMKYVNVLFLQNKHCIIQFKFQDF